MRRDLRISVAVAVGLGLGIAVAVQATSAHAQDYPPAATTLSATGPDSSKPTNEYTPEHHFFVEIIARSAASYGHMYVMYGEANERHEVIRSQIAGFFPAGDAQDCINCSVYLWSLGHLLPVPSEIGASDGDLEEQYVAGRYRVWIDQAMYDRLVAYIEHRKATKGPWHAFLNNCVTFDRDVAVFIGLDLPPAYKYAPVVLVYPKTFVEVLRKANGGAAEDDGPLKDAPGVLPPEIASEFDAPIAPPAKKVAAKKPKAHASAEQKAVVAAASFKRRTANARPKDDLSDSVH